MTVWIYVDWQKSSAHLPFVAFGAGSFKTRWTGISSDLYAPQKGRFGNEIATSAPLILRRSLRLRRLLR